MADPDTPIRTPHCLRRDFLEPGLVAALLAFAQANQARFVPSQTGSGAHSAVRPTRRVSLTAPDFSPLRESFAQLVRPLAPSLAAELKVAPFEVSEVELELIAHGDGAFLARHIDTQIDAVRHAAPSLRLLSGVYYFHAAPKAFEGGALRLHEIAGDAARARFLDIAPLHNTLVFFPSWMPHEVMPVRVPSGRFMDSRFAINCWFRRKTA